MNALASLLVLAASALSKVAVPALVALLTLVGPAPTNPTTTSRSKVISTVTGISATTTDCDETAGYYEIPRGADNISFRFLATLNTGFSTGSVFFTGTIVGCDTPDGTYTPIPGLTTLELVVDVGQTFPSASDAPGVTLPRFIKVKWTETGSMTSFTATCTIRYNLDGGAGRQYSPDYVGG